MLSMSAGAQVAVGLDGCAKISAASTAKHFNGGVRASLSTAPAYQSLFNVGDNTGVGHGLNPNRTSPVRNEALEDEESWFSPLRFWRLSQASSFLGESRDFLPCIASNGFGLALFW